MGYCFRIFWVPGAACGIYGIRNAGVAVAVRVGTWSHIQVVTSCIFGIIIFKEQVNDANQTIIPIVILTIGLIGMSRYSHSSVTTSSHATHRLSAGLKSDYQPITISNSDQTANSAAADYSTSATAPSFLRHHGDSSEHLLFRTNSQRLLDSNWN
jgi:hypothetical protein